MKLSRDNTILRFIAETDIDENGYFKVPDGVISIDKKAGTHVEVRRKLNSIDINAVETIGDDAFLSCENLKKVTGSPKIIGSHAFAYCKKLAKFDFSNTTGLGVGTFSDSGLRNIDISGINTIPTKAFANCIELRSVTGSPQFIRDYAFSYCEKLTSFDFSNTTDMFHGAFFQSGLVDIDTKNINDISARAFAYCNKLRKVVGSPLTVGTKTFWDCPKLREVRYSPETIGDGAFYGCAKLTSFDFSKLEYIDSNAFAKSGIERCITVTDEGMSINFQDYKAKFAFISDFDTTAEKIGDVINERKNIYLDKSGDPFILTKNHEKVYLTKDKERFLELLLFHESL